jgi:hypothetical protein
VFTFHLAAFVQSPFADVKDRFGVGPPEIPNDPQIAKRSSCVDSNSCPAKAAFAFQNREKPKDLKSREYAR